jgi:hypothetical protein
VTADSHPDLFWALRGGGGDYAIVTAMQFRLHHEPELYGGRIIWPAAQARQVLEAYGQVTASAPEELTVWASLLNPPGDAPALAVIDLAYLGGEDQTRSLLAPFERIGGSISDNRHERSMLALGDITGDPADPSPGISRSELLTGLDHNALDTLTGALAGGLAPVLVLQLRHLAGALAAPSDNPHGGRPEPYLLGATGVPFAPGMETAIRIKQGELFTAMGDHLAYRTPSLTTLGPSGRAADVFAPDVLERLRQVKAAYDPDGVVRSNFPVA